MSPLTLPLSWFARLAIVLSGWTLVAPPRDRPKKFVAILGHHTSHWDLVLALLAFWAYRISFRILVKKEVFEVPGIGWLVKVLGGIPVDRGNSRQGVGTLAKAFMSGSCDALALAPSGTRSKREGWKMGFYVLARRARCPVTLGYIDWKTRQVSVGAPFHLTGDVERDMAAIREFYADKVARFPEKVTPIRPCQREAKGRRRPIASSPPSARGARHAA